MEFVEIPAGSFQMGSPEGESGRLFDEVQHERFVDQFWMGKFEVTQGQWEAVMGSNPSHFSNCGVDCPVECVSWHDVQEFIGRLDGREAANGSSARYRLPTEAEWEYAARAGTTGARYGELDEIAWWSGNSGGRPHPVGLKRANPWGLHDMLGNVWEWTSDRYRSYPGAEGFEEAEERVIRGGSIYHIPWHPRSALRWSCPANKAHSDSVPFSTIPHYSRHPPHIGFRLVRTG